MHNIGEIMRYMFLIENTSIFPTIPVSKRPKYWINVFDGGRFGATWYEREFADEEYLSKYPLKPHYRISVRPKH